MILLRLTKAPEGSATPAAPSGPGVPIIPLEREDVAIRTLALQLVPAPSGPASVGASGSVPRLPFRGDVGLGPRPMLLLSLRDVSNSGPSIPEGAIVHDGDGGPIVSDADGGFIVIG